MELIKLLDVANPKLIKDTLNRVSQDYETFRTEIEEIANAALNTAVTANATANTALTTVTDYEAVVMESAQDSAAARQTAEEALAMITQADERSQEAALLAEQSFTEASEAVQTSELAMNVANEAKSTVDQALDIGTLGSFVHNVNGIALAHAHMTDNPNQADDEELSYLATPTLVREALKNKADITNNEQTITAKEIKIETSETNSLGDTGDAGSIYTKFESSIDSAHLNIEAKNGLAASGRFVTITANSNSSTNYLRLSTTTSTGFPGPKAIMLHSGGDILFSANKTDGGVIRCNTNSFYINRGIITHDDNANAFSFSDSVQVTNDLVVGGTIMANGENVATQSSLLNLVYPVGSIYMSVNNVSPASFLGGTWEQLKDRFLLGAGDVYTNGTTGGAATHTLTVDEMPEHNHDVFLETGTLPSQSGVLKWTSAKCQAYAYSVGLNGGSQPHNNMPPYLVVYMWKRTA